MDDGAGLLVPIERALTRVSLFAALPPDELRALARQAVRRKYARHELIFSQGEPGDGLYIVDRGHVLITRQNPEGDELVLSVMDRGEYFGELALFDDEPRSAGAVASADTTLLFLSRTSFREFIQSHPLALFASLRVIVAQLRRTTDLADEIALLDIRARLVKRLVRLVREGHLETRRGSPGGTLRITQQQFANMLGATRESVNKHLNALAGEGTVQLQRGRIHLLDLDALEEEANLL